MTTMEENKPKIGILIVTFNAASTLVEVLKRIPENVWNEVTEVIIMDDASHDATFEIAHGYKQTRSQEKLKIIRNEKNLGYGGNQKEGYRYCIENNFDCVVLLHGDGQYKPELLSDIYKPIIMGHADAVFGTRMSKTYGGPLKGGMPRYKYIGNRILSSLQNYFLDMNLSEFHSGYRAYAIKALKEINLSEMTNDFHFDTEVILKFNHQGFIILEVPIPTYYGDEICHVNGLNYAKNVLRSVWRYNRTVSGVSNAAEYREYFRHYPTHTERFSSHWWIEKLTGEKNLVMDIGCSTGELAKQLKANNNRVTGIDILESHNISASIDEYEQADLNEDLQPILAKLKENRYDKIIMADILEHLVQPTKALSFAKQILNPKGRLLVSLPNIANITIRWGLLLGRFKYSDRGILDSTHLHFYTLKSAKMFFEENGFRVTQHFSSNMPIERALGVTRRFRLWNYLLSIATRLFPGLLGFQHIFVLELANQNDGNTEEISEIERNSSAA